MLFNVIIPMAGDGLRFNNGFKPFIKLDDTTIIEHMMLTFLKYNENIKNYHFIITQDHEDIYNVKENLLFFFEKISEKIKVHIINEKTKGPYQTIIKGIKENVDNVFICDCDHQINIYPMLENIYDNNDIEILIPIWDIKYEDQQDWGKVIFENGSQTFVEKEIVEPNDNKTVCGIIGCYYLKNTSLLSYNVCIDNMTDYLKTTKNKLTFCKLKEAYFFGTPQMVKKYIDIKRNYENILCDIDGVLFIHSNNSTNNYDDNVNIKECSKKLKEWKKENKKIILLTARSKKNKNELQKLLKEKDIIYDELIMGLYPGTRYIINDIKPSHIFTKQSVGINLIRDYGIDHINCNEYLNNNIKILNILKGGSFSTVFLIEKNSTKYVRKVIIKNEDNKHYEVLKRQVEDLKRFYFYKKNIVPKIHYENDNSDNYYYDMEYLDGYKQLDEFTEEIQNNVIVKLLDILKNDVYVYSKLLDNKNEYLDLFIKEKIMNKFEFLSELNPIIKHIIKSEEIIINGKKYNGLLNVFSLLNIYKFSFNYICPIHGDLNFQNILYNVETDDIKIIDMDGSKYMDSPVFDLAKIFQSIISRYEKWHDIDDVILSSDINNIETVDTFFSYEKNKIIDSVVDKFKEILKIEDTKEIFNIGIFFMTTYFIRFVPFRLKKSLDHGIFALIMATVWLNNIYNEKCFKD